MCACACEPGLDWMAFMRTSTSVEKSTSDEDTGLLRASEPVDAGEGCVAGLSSCVADVGGGRAPRFKAFFAGRMSGTDWSGGSELSRTGCGLIGCWPARR